MKKKAKKVFKVQAKSETQTRTPQAGEGSSTTSEKEAEVPQMKLLKDKLTQLVASNDEKYIVGFSKDQLAQPYMKTKEEVLKYVLSSCTSEETFTYFVKELEEYLQMKREQDPKGSGEAEAWEEPEYDQGPEVEQWDQEMEEDGDPLDHMQKNFAAAKDYLDQIVKQLNSLTNRVTAHGEVLKSHAQQISSLLKGSMEGTTPDELKDLGRQVKDLMKLVSDKDFGTTSGEYVIKYPDGKSKSLEGMILPPQWEKLLDLATTRDNIFLAGPTQCGKTTTASMLAEALDLPFSSLSCSEGMDESVFAGTILPNENGVFKYVPSTFVSFYENGGVFLLDEFCGADANLGMFINNAIGNDHFYLQRRQGNERVNKHPDFICIAADNTMGNGGDEAFVGRNQMDASTMERFRTGFVLMDYSQKIEKSISDPDVYEWCMEIRKALIKLNFTGRFMTTRTMKRFTIMKNERNWTFEAMHNTYFADWEKGDVDRVMSFITAEAEKNAGEF